MSFIRINKFVSKSGCERELHEFLLSLKSYVESSEGNSSYEVAVENEDPHSFLVIERWDRIESHQKSIGNFPKDEMMKVVSMLSGPPEGKFYKI